MAVNALKLCFLNCKILVEREAETASGFTNSEYKNSKAEICQNAEKIWTDSDLILKVKCR